MGLRIVGLLFPIGKICRCIVEFTPRTQEIQLRLPVRRCRATAEVFVELRAIGNIRSWHLADIGCALRQWI